MKLDDLDLIALLSCLFLVAIVLVIVIATHEAKHRPKKTNIRVPRETLWARTNRYHGDTE